MKVIDALVKIANGEDIKFKIKSYEGIYFTKKIMKTKSLFYENLNKDTKKVEWCIFDKWLNEEIELIEDILDKKEKEYLSAVIKPFRDKIRFIEKHIYGNKEFIWLSFRNDYEDICLPYFKIGTMYKGMKLYKSYTLEELGL